MRHCWYIRHISRRLQCSENKNEDARNSTVTPIVTAIAVLLAIDISVAILLALAALIQLVGDVNSHVRAT